MSAKVIDRKLIIDNVIYKVSNIPEVLRPPQSTCLIETFNLNFVFPLSRERTAASCVRISSSETPYGPNQRTFNVLLDLFVYFSLAAFCFWWQYLFSLFSHTNYLHTQNISTFFDCFVNKHSQAIPYNAELVTCSFNVRGLSNTMKRRETFRWLKGLVRN